MTREEASRRIQDLRRKVEKPKYRALGWLETWIYKEDIKALDLAIKALEQEPTTKIEESNFSQEQYKTDLQCAYDCGKSILDKIRTEIEQRPYGIANDSVIQGMKYERAAILEILDKYKAESEE